MSTKYTVTITGYGPKQWADVLVRDDATLDGRVLHRAARDVVVRKVFGRNAEWSPIEPFGEHGLVFAPVPARDGGGVRAITGQIRIVVKPRKT